MNLAKFSGQMGALLFCGVAAACQPTPPNSGAPMPPPTVSTLPEPDSTSTGMQASSLSMINAKIRKPIGERPTAAYLTIENSGATPERLTALSSPDFERVELHDMTMDGTMMKMARLDGLDIPAASQAVMAPGGKHIMLFNAKRPLNNGDTITITLTFSNSGPIETRFVVLNEIPRPAGNLSQ